MPAPYVSPTFKASAYNCPFCGAFAAHNWQSMYTNNSLYVSESRRWTMSWCSHCARNTVWHDDTMVYPDVAGAPLPHDDLPLDLAQDFEEARSVLQRSPRSSAALLRLVVQKLCVKLGEKGKNINVDIGSLVARGLPVQVQQALDIVRVVGNEQVHPGQLDVRDDPQIALELFRLINFIVEDRITRPKVIAGLYGSLPEDKLKGIEERDARSSSPTPTAQ